MHDCFRRTRRVFAIGMAALVVMLGVSASAQRFDQEQAATLELVDAFLAARARHDFDGAATFLADHITVVLEGETRTAFDGMRHLVPPGATYTVGPRHTDGNEVFWIETVVQQSPQPLSQTSRHAIVDGSASMPEPTPGVEPLPATSKRAVRAVVQDAAITSLVVRESAGVAGVGARDAPVLRVLIVGLAVSVVGCVVSCRARPARRTSANPGRLLQALNVHASGQPRARLARREG
jgi:hypothetical protein